jgi:predicted DNA-binding ribbon-helix-helix protein
MTGLIRKRSVVIAGHATSLTLEEPFWEDLRLIARRRGLSLNALIGTVDAGRSGNLSSALRLFVLDCYRSGELGPRDRTQASEPPEPPSDDDDSAR